jgi:transposase-like protein
MSGFHAPINKEIKEEILAKVKEGKTVTETAAQYGVSTKTIYTWLSNKATGEPGTLEPSRLRRENQELYTLIGRITAQLERSKKK